MTLSPLFVDDNSNSHEKLGSFLFMNCMLGLGTWFP